MAGHSKFKNIQHRKDAQDSKKAKVFAKIISEVSNSVQIGGPDPKNNPSLRAALEKAKAANVPKDRIQKAITEYSDQKLSSSDQVLYEGFIQGCAFLIEVDLADSARVISDIKSVFKKFLSSTSESGSAAYLFSRVGILYCAKNEQFKENDILELIEKGDILDFAEEESQYVLYSPYEKLATLTKELNNIVLDEFIGYKPNNVKIIEDAERLSILKDALYKLTNIDKIKRVYYDFQH
jgi:YebC/PmpR family DNA-binding regulatory protein